VHVLDVASGAFVPASQAERLADDRI